jgi:hypothetical protein
MNLGASLRSSLLNRETTAARAAFAKKNNREQSSKALSQPEKLLKALEQKSGLIVEQMQKLLFEQNYDLRNHAQDLKHPPTAQKL